MTPTRWRLNDPAVEWRHRWTKVHLTDGDTARTLCGIDVPEWPYMLDEGEQVPDGAERCRACAKRAAK